MSKTDRQFTGAIKASELTELIESRGFTVDSAAVGALTYEVFGHSLKKHFRLLASVRNTEAVKHNKGRKLQHRIMGTLWFGKYYQDGFVIEVFGSDLDGLMIGHAAALQEKFGHEAQVICRTLTKKKFE